MQVEVWSDVTCPWCFIGKRRLEAALEQFEHRDEVNVLFRSFELDPDAPPGGRDATDRLAERHGVPREWAEGMQQRVTDAAAGAGLVLRLDIARAANTFDAHRLLHLAAARGCQGELKERFMRAYFMEGERLGDPVTLERLATEAGLPADEVRDVLSSDRYGAAVRADEELGRRVEIMGVPFVAVDRDLAVSGAQAPDVLLELLQQSWDRLQRRRA